MPRQLIDSERVFRGRVFDVERDRLREASGMEMIREVVRHPGGAGGLPLYEDGRVGLVRQYRHPARRELLEIPAGRIEAVGRMLRGFHYLNEFDHPGQRLMNAGVGGMLDMFERVESA